jgi:lambda repressor-like predicted transcriptional regulator
MIDRSCPIAVGPGGLVVVITPKALIGACAERGWSLTELAGRARISRPTLPGSSHTPSSRRRSQTGSPTSSRHPEHGWADRRYP